MILNKEGAMHSAKQFVCKHAIAKKSTGKLKLLLS